MEKFRNKYRIPSSRLQTWDYSWPGMYFITICTKKRKCFFGEIVNGEMYLNEIGKIADECWSEIPKHFENVELGQFQIMPNHVHGIIIINERKNGNGKNDGYVETGHTLSLPSKSHPRFRNQGKNTVSSMVGSFKSAVSKLCRNKNLHFGWQSRFHDHIIRWHDDFIRISNYIRNNPKNWKGDKFYT